MPTTKSASKALEAGEPDASWFVYILRCADGSLYTGVAKDIDQRLKAHNAGEGARYTRGRAPVELVYRERCADQSLAVRREWDIKQMSRPRKLALIRASALSKNIAPPVL